MLPWILLMVLLSPVQGFEKLYKLNDFQTYEECKIERDRVGFEMAEAYPYEQDFVIECRERPSKNPKKPI